MYFIYILQSQAKKYIYIGLSNNVARRFKQHQRGTNKTTRPYRPFDLPYIEEFETRIDARKREKYLKSGIGKEWIKRKLSKNARVAELADALL